MFRTRPSCTRSVRGGFAVAALVAPLFALDSPAHAVPARESRSVTAPAQSTRILPDVRHASSAVDPAGASLVVGDEHSATASRNGIRAYFRDASGHWKTSVVVLPKSRFPKTAQVGDTAVAAGGAGFFVIAWTMLTYTGESWVSTVYGTSRSPSGEVRAATKLFTTTYPDQPGQAPADGRLRLATNDNGDAALTQAAPQKAARYLRGTGWTVYDLPVEGGEAPPVDPRGPSKHAAVAMMSPARTVDITYAYRAGTHDVVRQATLTSSAGAFTVRTIHTVADTSLVRFGIARDASGLQTLVVTDAGDAVVVYREQTRRGPLHLQFNEPDSDNTSYPHVASRGEYTRVSWRLEGDDDFAGYSRLYDGQTWGQPVSGYGNGRDPGIHVALAIGVDGRGVEATWQGPDGDTTTAYRSNQEVSSRTDEVISTRADEPPSIDVGRSGVSQYVVHEVPEGGALARTVVRIRR